MMARYSGRWRRVALQHTDSRIRKMSELLTCIKVVKMYAWEKPFAQHIQQIRILERDVLAKSAYFQAGWIFFVGFFFYFLSFYGLLIPTVEFSRGPHSGGAGACLGVLLRGCCSHRRKPHGCVGVYGRCHVQPGAVFPRHCTPCRPGMSLMNVELSFYPYGQPLNLIHTGAF
jgi:hypothetical protein